MSFLESGKDRFTWTAAPARRSTRPDHGCVQCGARLETDEAGKIDSSGKCPNCISWVSDEDEIVDELDD